MSDASEPDPMDEATLVQLNAYLDGELDQRAQLAFEERLNREPALRTLLEGMRAIDHEVTESLGAVPQSPPNDALLAAVKNFAAAHATEATPQASNVVSFESRRTVKSVEPKPWQLPLAAGIALCVGAGAMSLVQSLQGPGVQSAAVAVADGVIVEGGALHAALERAGSGEVQSAAGEKIRPILSFAAKDGRFCREFESFGGKGAVVGVACKGDRGWTMEVLLSSAPHSPNETQYAPASGFNAKALDDVVSQLIEGQPMSPEAESAARGQGWRKGNTPVP